MFFFDTRASILDVDSIKTKACHIHINLLSFSVFALLSSALHFSSLLCSASFFSDLLCSSLLWSALLLSALLYPALLFSFLIFSAPHCTALLFSALFSSALLFAYSAFLCFTFLFLLFKLLSPPVTKRRKERFTWPLNSEILKLIRTMPSLETDWEWTSQLQ